MFFDAAIFVVAYEIVTSEMATFVLTTFWDSYFRDPFSEMVNSIKAVSIVAAKILLYGSQK